MLKDGIHRWHRDWWHAIVTAALDRHPDRVQLDYHSALSRPAISRYAATSPALLAWFKGYDAGRPYREQVKPFNFLLSMTPSDTIDRSERLYAPKRRRPKKRFPVRPVAPFDSDYGAATARAFDRETGASIHADALATYAEALCQYHISPEAKFLNRSYADRGATQRRHIRVAGIRHVGKEANDLERQAVLGFDPDATIDYSQGREDSPIFLNLLHTFANASSIANAARVMGMTRSSAKRLLETETLPSSDQVRTFERKLMLANDRLALEKIQRTKQMCEICERVTVESLRKTARRLGLDPANLSRRLTSFWGKERGGSG